MRPPPSVLPLLVALLLTVACSASPTAPAQGPTVSAFAGLTERFETAHIVFHHAAGDSVDGARSEAHVQWLASYLGVTLPSKIGYYKFRHLEDYWSAASRRFNLGGSSNPVALELYTVQPFHAHEIVHLFTGQLGDPNSFFHEGMSNAFQNDPLNGDYEGRDHWSGRTFHDIARDYRARGILAPIPMILDNDGLASYAGSVVPAGSFIRYLADTRGIARLKQVLASVGWYDSRDVVADKLQAAYGVSVSDLQAGWLAFLDAGRRTP